MTIRSKPNYGIYPLNLNAAGSQDLPVVGTRVVLVTALTSVTYQQVAGQSIVSGGTVAPSTIINVQIGKAMGDPVPLGINGKINVEDAFEFVRISWGAQPNVTAFLLIDDDRAGAGVQADSPAAVLGGAVSISQLGVQYSGKLGSSFAAVIPAALGVTTFLAAASNLVGCWLRSATVQGSSANNVEQLYVDASAPSGINDATKRMLLNSASNLTVDKLAYPLWLPPGIGIYLAAGGAAGLGDATWDLGT